MLYIILRYQLIVCLTCISIHLITPPSRSEGLIVTNTVDVFKDFLNARNHMEFPSSECRTRSYTGKL